MPVQLDLRHLGAPQPMLRALAAADILAPGERLSVVTPMLPRPLLIELALRCFEADPGQPQSDRSVRVQIRRPTDAGAAS